MEQPQRSGIGSPSALSLPLSSRDRALVELVARFRQLSAGQIFLTLFAGCASKTPCDRALKRLCERRFLSRLARPVGGDGGGSSQYVYQLGRAGWRLLGQAGAYWAARSVNLHTLAVAQCYVALKQAEAAGSMGVLRFETEPECHRSVGTVHLTPDAYAEVGLATQRMKYSLFLEIDRGTEHANVIRGKCAHYWRAYQQWAGEHFPYVVFVVPDANRARDIRRVVTAGPEAALQMFHIYEAARLVEDIHRSLQ